MVIKISDGFGNQLFMYATGYAIAQHLRDKIYLDTTQIDTNQTRKFELDKLNINYEKRIYCRFSNNRVVKKIYGRIARYYLTKKYTSYIEQNPYKYEKNIMQIKDNTYLQGYWQNEKYFIEYRKELQRMFTPAYNLDAMCADYIAIASQTNSVAVHVRRGDYEIAGQCISNNYYYSAIEYICKKIENPTFLVFSDDIEYAKQIFQNVNMEKIMICVNTKYRDLDEFFIMNSCKNFIIANSTYSWWAAWLSDNDSKIIICPEVKQWIGDFYPEGWIRIRAYIEKDIEQIPL